AAGGVSRALGVGPPGGGRRPQPPGPAARERRRGLRAGGDGRGGEGRGRVLRRDGRDARHAAAQARARCARVPALGRRRRRGEARCGDNGVTMDFELSDEQRRWQDKARKFAREEIRPISLQRDAIEDPAKTWDWDIIKKGSKLGFRTMAVPKEWGGEGTDFVTQALVMAELAKADSAISKSFSQCWKWSHLIAQSCTEEQKQRFLKPFLADDTFVLGKGISEYDAGSDNRLPPDDPR